MHLNVSAFLLIFFQSVSWGIKMSAKWPKLYSVIGWKESFMFSAFHFERSCGRKVSSLSDLLFLRILSSLSRHLSVSLTPVPSPLAAGQEGRGRSGQFEETFPPSIPLPSFPSLSALQSSLSTLITYINVSNKKPTLRVGPCVSAGRGRAPAPVCVWLCQCVIDPSQQLNRAVIVGLSYNSQQFLCAANQREMSIFCPPAVNDGADVETGGICEEYGCLYVLSRINDREEEEEDRKIGH